MSRLGALCGLLVLSLLFLVSCASTFEITSDHLSIARDSCRQQGVPVDVLWKPPDRPFVAIAHVVASSHIPESATWEEVKKRRDLINQIADVDHPGAAPLLLKAFTEMV